MARALIVGCGCRGRELGTALAERGWQVRGTSRTAEGIAAIERAGLEGVEADPDRIGTLVEHFDSVAVVYWLLAWADGDPEAVAALHGPRLERVLEEIVDTPVRGFVYELGAGEHATNALPILRDAAERWRIPFEVVDADPREHALWVEAMVAAAEELVGG